MGAQEWVMGLTIYFIGVIVMVTLFSIAGVFSVSTSGGHLPTPIYNSTSTNLPTGITSTFSIGKILKDVFSFFVFNISISDTSSFIYSYIWLVRLILVQIPVLALLISVWYSLPTVGN